jgi:hypothetical protein
MGASSSAKADAIRGGAIRRAIAVQPFRGTPKFRIDSSVRSVAILRFPHLEGQQLLDALLIPSSRKPLFVHRPRLLCLRRYA